HLYGAALKAVAVFLEVGIVESGFCLVQPCGSDRPLGYDEADLIALALISSVSQPNNFAPFGGDFFGIQLSVSFALELLVGRLDDRSVSGSKAEPVGCHKLVLLIRGQQPDTCDDAWMSRDQYVRHFEFSSNLTGEQGASSTGSDKSEISRIIPPAN